MHPFSLYIHVYTNYIGRRYGTYSIHVHSVKHYTYNYYLPLLFSATTLSEKFCTKDDLRRDNERMCSDIETLSREHKKLKQIVDQLRQDYEQSKEFDPVRRYDKLKGMVKRTIMHIKLSAADIPTTTAVKPGMRRLSYVQGCKELNFQSEIAKRREEKYSSK